MKVKSYQVFVAMYYIVDVAYDTIKDDDILTFLTDANPFIWKGDMSGDPAVYNEFKEYFVKKFGDSTDEKSALEFVRNYLDRDYPPILVEAFDSIVTPDNWIIALNG